MFLMPSFLLSGKGKCTLLRNWPRFRWMEECPGMRSSQRRRRHHYPYACKISGHKLKGVYSSAHQNTTHVGRIGHTCEALMTRSCVETIQAPCTSLIGNHMTTMVANLLSFKLWLPHGFQVPSQGSAQSAVRNESALYRIDHSLKIWPI